MKDMRLKADITGKFATQIWYIVVIPLFFFLFMLLYTPFDARSFLDCGRGLFAFNVTILTAIEFIFMLCSRTCLHFIRRNNDLPVQVFYSWMVGEAVVVAFFMALYVYLMWRGTIPYFSALGKCIGLSILVSIYPYLMITLLLSIKTLLLNKYASIDNESHEDNALIRFKDSAQRLKLAISASSVVYVEAEENYVRIHYLEGDRMKEYVLRNSMKSVEETVERFGLVRSHRSYIVNPAHVKMLRKDKEGVIVADFDVTTEPIAVSKKYYGALASLLGL